jgi:hypothetical protein
MHRELRNDLGVGLTFPIERYCRKLVAEFLVICDYTIVHNRESPIWVRPVTNRQSWSQDGNLFPGLPEGMAVEKSCETVCCPARVCYAYVRIIGPFEINIGLID